MPPAERARVPAFYVFMLLFICQFCWKCRPQISNIENTKTTPTAHTHNFWKNYFSVNFYFYRRVFVAFYTPVLDTYLVVVLCIYLIYRLRCLLVRVQILLFDPRFVANI